MSPSRGLKDKSGHNGRHGCPSSTWVSISTWWQEQLFPHICHLYSTSMNYPKSTDYMYYWFSTVLNMFYTIFKGFKDWFPLKLSPRDSQESSPTPQFKSINFLVLSFHYGPTLTSVYDYCFHYLVLWGKGQFSFQSQRKAMPKNAQTTTQLHSSHTLVK